MMKKTYKKAIDTIVARLAELKTKSKIANQEVDNYINDSSRQDDNLFDELLQERTWARCQVFTLEVLLKYDLDEFDNKYFNR